MKDKILMENNHLNKNKIIFKNKNKIKRISITKRVEKISTKRKRDKIWSEEINVKMKKLNNIKT